ncbi:MAG TPA: HAD-IB family phosphatase [Burkholderiales bacterium]|nr:HAD-IB family phosphatase [Burkholderiales bacterium]
MPEMRLYFDFDNTLTAGDVLDDVIATFSPDERWRRWEEAWMQGRISARDCLRAQVGALRVTREALLRHLAPVRIDPAFPGILAWARRRGVEVSIVSDSFVPLIQPILRNNGIRGVRVLANELSFAGDRLVPSFPHYDPAFPRSANAKARHLARRRAATNVFAGDGRSDLDAALAADIVFAKDILARELAARRVGYRPFETLAPVLEFLEASGLGQALAAAASA